MKAVPRRSRMSLDGFARGQAVGQLDDGPLGIAEDQQVGLRVGQHRAAHLVGPVVVVGNAAQAGLDASRYDVGSPG